MYMQQNTFGWMRRFQERGALWKHDGNPKRPHVILTTEREHSSGFFNSGLVVADERLLREAADDTIALLVNHGLVVGTVDCVVGPATGATKLAEAVHIELNRRGGRSRWASPYKTGEGPDKKMVFRETTVYPGEWVLLVEDVISTGGSVELAACVVQEKGGMLLPYIGALVNRSGLIRVGGREIVALIDRSVPKWDPKRCPLCELGSKAIRPKDPCNWELLNKPY